MNVTPEEKDYLIDQLEVLIGTRPMFYLKFCACDTYTQDVINGNLFSNTASYFREQEIRSGERGQGDAFETINIIQLQNITVHDNANGNIFLTAPKGELKSKFGVDEEIPIISFVGVPLRDMQLIEADETHADFALPFTEEEYNTMKERFGNSCVVINARELEQRIESYCNFIGAEYIFDKVAYCPQNTTERINAFNSGSKERFLFKNEDLKYQREFRLAIGIEMPEDHFIRIGALQNAIVLESNALNNIAFSISYSSSPIEQ